MQPLESESKTAGGIIIPEMAKEKPSRGVVIAAGPGAYKTERGKGKGKEKEKKFVPTEVKSGETVLYERYMASEFELDGEKVVMVRESSILGIFELEGGNSTALQKKGPSELEKPKKSSTALEKTKKPAAKAKTKK
jgi:chaperonin GroES